MHGLLPGGAHHRLYAHREGGSDIRGVAAGGGHHATAVRPRRTVTLPSCRKIIHISDKNAKALGIKEYVSTDKTQDIVHTSPLYEAITVNGPTVTVNGPTVTLNKSKASTIRKSRTNFVTSEGYDPQANLEQIDNLLSASSVRGSRARLN